MSKNDYLLEDSIGYLIFMINQKMHGFFREKLDREEINVVEAWVLLQILNKIKTISGLKNVLNVDMAQIQRACNRLLEKKWIARVVDSYDKRVKIFSLTEPGEKLIRRVISYSKETNAKALEGLNKDEKNALRGMLINVLEGPFFKSSE